MKKSKYISGEELVVIIILVITIVIAFIRAFYYNELSGSRRGTMVGYAYQECFKSLAVGILTSFILIIFVSYNWIKRLFRKK